MNYRKPMLWVSIAAVIIVICVAVGLINSPKPKTESIPTNTKDSSIEKLWESRTEYVGDNSAVGNIVGTLSFPDSVTYSGIQLDTQATPFAITINLKAHTNARNYDTEELHREQFKVNAMILFSLIENVKRITFSIDDPIHGPASLVYTSSQAQDILGENYFSKTKTLEGFKAVLSKLFESDFPDYF